LAEKNATGFIVKNSYIFPIFVFRYYFLIVQHSFKHCLRRVRISLYNQSSENTWPLVFE